MQAVVMAGGLGTRLRPFTNVLPKPLVPIGDLSVLEMILRQLAGGGFEDVIVSVGYKSELIMAVIGDGSNFGLSIDYVHETEPLGTVGSLRLMDQLQNDFLVMNGDLCTDLEFADVLAAHQGGDAVITVGSYSRHEKIELGVLEVDGGLVVGFEEKPEFDFQVSMGIYAMSREVLSFLPKTGPFGFDQLIHVLLAAGAPIANYPFDGSWCDIGRIEDYQWFVDEFASHRSRYLPNE